MNILKILTFLVLVGLSLFEGNAIENFIQQNSYSASTEVLKRLLEIEDILEKNLSNYVTVLKGKLALTQNALNNFQAEATKMSYDMETYLSNLLNSFALIRHQQQDWGKWAVFMDQVDGQEQIAFAHDMRPKLPTAVDLEEASRSIELLSTYYELEPNELANGNLSGHSQPESALSSLDCFEMGMFNYYQEDYLKAEMWLNASLSKYDSSQRVKYDVYNFSKHKIHKWLGVLLVKRKAFAAGLWHINQVERKEYDAIVEGLISMGTNMMHCAASLHRPTNLHCRYNNSTTPFLRIAPLKVEELSTDPFIVLYHEVIYESEIELLLNTSLGWQPALVVEDEVSYIRTAKDVFLDSIEDKVTDLLHARLTDMSGFIMNGSDILSLINYGIGGHYGAHLDAFEVELPTGNRIATALFYLSDVEMGGATIFPKLNLTVAPKKGTAILWHNLQNDGEIHEKSLHAACPVIVGSKYVLTKWIYNLNQMFIKPCKANVSSG